MKPDRWNRIEELFHATLQVEAPHRAAHLVRECGGDEVLRREVESLIAASEGQSFIEKPAVTLAMKVLNAKTGSLVGQSIGHYKIIRLLGAGGMGEVYLADDLNLERRVALKFLASGFDDDQWAREHLMKEARAVARLENPNICAVHGIEQVADHNFIVMQYVEGQTLASLLHEGPLGIDQALEFAEQIAGALAAAHVRGIIHHDVKPHNIVVTNDGQIKVLDFGLSKFVRPPQEVEAPANPQDQTLQLGVIIGTVAYMSPEQARGRELDCRSDVFSFGIVLYEMLSGKNPFLRETKEETIKAIKKSPAPPLQQAPEELATIISSCLEKDLEQRFETAEQIRLALRRLRSKRESKNQWSRYTQAIRNHPHFRLYAIAALAFIAILIGGGIQTYSKITQVHTLAVLPIINKSGDPNKDYLSEGLTRNLFEKFSYLPRLKVKLPTMTTMNQGQEVNPVRAGRALNVEAVLAGEIVKQGEHVRLHVTMTKTADGRQLWDETINIDAADMFALQDRITRGVTSNLGMWLVGSEKQLLTKRQTGDEEALRLYMNGRYFWSLKRDRENIQKAIGFFEKALDRDPAFAKAYTGLADCYAIMSTVGYGTLETKEAMEKAHWAARQALELEESPEAHTSMGVLKLRYDWEWDVAEEEFKRAIALNPDYPQSHYWYANLLAILGRFDEGIRQSQIARELDPYSPLAEMNYGRALYYARKFDEAESYFRTLLERDSEYPQFLNIMGLVQQQQGNISGAHSTLEKLHSINPLMAAAPLGYAYGKGGKHDAARRLLRDLDEISKSRPVPAQEKAIIHLGMGEMDKAFVQLEKSYIDRFPALAYLTTDPLYADLRPDPRFASLARRVGLAP